MAERIPQYGRSSVPLPDGIPNGDPRKGKGRGVRFKGSTGKQIEAGKILDAVREDRERTLPNLVESLIYTPYTAASYPNRTIDEATLPNNPGMPPFGFKIEGNDIGFNGRAFEVHAVLSFQDPGSPNRVVGHSFTGEHWEPDGKGTEQPGSRIPLPPAEAATLAMWSLDLYRGREAARADATIKRDQRRRILAAEAADKIFAQKLAEKIAAERLAALEARENSLRETVELDASNKKRLTYTATLPDGRIIRVSSQTHLFRGEPSISGTITTTARRPRELGADEAGQLYEQLADYYQNKAAQQTATSQESIDQ